VSVTLELQPLAEAAADQAKTASVASAATTHLIMLLPFLRTMMRLVTRMRPPLHREGWHPPEACVKLGACDRSTAASC
jgi:hypothetical protein